MVRKEWRVLAFVTALVLLALLTTAGIVAITQTLSDPTDGPENSTEKPPETQVGTEDDQIWFCDDSRRPTDDPCMTRNGTYVPPGETPE